MQVQHQERNWCKFQGLFQPSRWLYCTSTSTPSSIFTPGIHGSIYGRIFFHSARDLKISRKQVDRCRSWASIWSQVQMAPILLMGSPWKLLKEMMFDSQVTSHCHIRLDKQSKGLYIQKQSQELRCFIFLHQIPPPKCHLCHLLIPRNCEVCNARLFVDENYDASHQLWRQRFVGVDGPTSTVQLPGLVGWHLPWNFRRSVGRNGRSVCRWKKMGAKIWFPNIGNEASFNHDVGENVSFREGDLSLLWNGWIQNPAWNILLIAGGALIQLMEVFFVCSAGVKNMRWKTGRQHVQRSIWTQDPQKCYSLTLVKWTLLWKKDQRFKKTFLPT